MLSHQNCLLYKFIQSPNSQSPFILFKVLIARQIYFAYVCVYLVSFVSVTKGNVHVTGTMTVMCIQLYPHCLAYCLKKKEFIRYFLSGQINFLKNDVSLFVYLTCECPANLRMVYVGRYIKYKNMFAWKFSFRISNLG